MNEIEREDRQFQAEIIDKIDALHGAVVRRRAAWGGSLATMAVAAVVWLWPAQPDMPIAEAPVLVAQQPEAPTVVVADVAAAEPTSPSAARMELFVLPAVEPEVDQPTWVVEPDEVIVDDAMELLAVATIADEIAPQTEPAAETPSLAPKRETRRYETTRRRKRLTDLIARSEDPNTDGTNFSISLI